MRNIIYNNFYYLSARNNFINHLIIAKVVISMLTNKGSQLLSNFRTSFGNLHMRSCWKSIKQHRKLLKKMVLFNTKKKKTPNVKFTRKKKKKKKPFYNKNNI
jgi:hypothetical protein